MPGKRTIALRDLIARGPVLSARQRERILVPAPSGATYTSDARVPTPVMPLQVFGVPYDLDLVIVDDHPDWDMHEYARVTTPDGSLWLCKDSRAGTLEQTIVGDVEGIEGWLPEIPLKRKRSPVKAVESVDGKRFRVSLAYENFDGEPVEVSFQGTLPAGPLWKRNSSTMGHSRGHVLAVLDLSHRSFGKRVSIRIGGKERKIRRIYGLVPFQVALAQTQAGLSVGAWQQDGTTTRHGDVAQTWTVTEQGSHTTVSQESPIRTLRYTFVEGELERAEVHTYGAKEPALVAHFAPRLPDVRRAFGGTHESRFVLDVNGQASFGTGIIRTTATPDGAVLDIRPTEPRWTRDRPLRSAVRFVQGTAEVEVTREAE